MCIDPRLRRNLHKFVLVAVRQIHRVIDVFGYAAHGGDKLVDTATVSGELLCKVFGKTVVAAAEMIGFVVYVNLYKLLVKLNPWQVGKTELLHHRVHYLTFGHTTYVMKSCIEC